MCLLLTIKNDSPKESKENLLAAFHINYDGIGIVHAQDSKLIIKKWLTKDKEKDLDKFEEFYEYYMSIPSEYPVMIHFRKSSSGGIIEDNIHPFVINDNVCYGLNGTINSLVFKETDKSDTWVLNDIVLKKLDELNPDFYSSPAVLRLLTSYIGLSKMVFFDSAGNFVYLNQDKGFFNDTKDIWYSNLAFKAKIEFDQKQQRKNNYKLKFGNKPKVVYPNNYEGREDSKKNERYYLIGDKYFTPLSLGEIQLLKISKGGNTRKLRNRGIIGRLKNVSDSDKIKAWIQYKKDFGIEDDKDNTRKILESGIIPNAVLPAQIALLPEFTEKYEEIKNRELKKEKDEIGKTINNPEE